VKNKAAPFYGAALFWGIAFGDCLFQDLGINRYFTDLIAFCC
jgi:hypothetical protein